MSRRWPISLLGLGLFLGRPALSPAQGLTLHGFLQANGALRIAGQDPGCRTHPIPACEREFPLGELRAQVEVRGSVPSGRGGLASKLELAYDLVSEEPDLELREGYLDLRLGPVDLRGGRQILTWGVGDLLFINDLFPKDYVAFFTGRPQEYLKVGSDALSLTVYPRSLTLQLVAIPFFEPDYLPTGDRFFFFDSFPELTPLGRVEPSTSLENTQLALRLSRHLAGYDLSLYFFRGFFGAPGVRLSPDGRSRTFFYPELSAYGLSVQGALAGGVGSLEAGLYDSRQDRTGRDPGIENSQVRYLLGYQRSWGDAFSLGLQYYGEAMLDYAAYSQNLPSSLSPRDRLRHLLTLRLTRLLRYQTLHLSLFAFLSLNGEGYYLIPEVRYDLDDHTRVVLGGNLFGGGSQDSFFGQFDQNDNLYTTLRLSF